MQGPRRRDAQLAGFTAHLETHGLRLGVGAGLLSRSQATLDLHVSRPVQVPRVVVHDSGELVSPAGRGQLALELAQLFEVGRRRIEVVRRFPQNGRSEPEVLLSHRLDGRRDPHEQSARKRAE